jgi:hypothetical protein
MVQKRLISGSVLIMMLLLLDYPKLNAGTLSDTIRVTDFGAVPGSRLNSTPFIIKALDACKGKENSVLYFPQGRYDFWPQHCVEKEYFESNTTDNNPKRLAIFIEHQKNLTVDGGGSEFVFHDRIQPFTVDSSDGITIKNLEIDWDIPLTAQGEIITVTNENIDLKINIIESPFIIENEKLVFVGEGWKSRWNGVMEFDRETRLIPPGTGDVPCLGNSWQQYKATDLGNGMVRLQYPFRRKPAAGNFLVLRHSERDHAGIFICNSRNIHLENLSIYHTAGLGILAQYSENLSYWKVSVVPNPKKNRYLSGHDDGFHYSNCKGRITVENCEFAGLMDDPINVHGTSVRVEEIHFPGSLQCKFIHHQSIGMKWGFPGDKVGFIENETMHTFYEGTILSFRRIDNELFELTFKDPLPAGIKPGDALENLTWTPAVSISGSRFKSCRARGILVSTPGKVVIENNTFESSGSAILIAGDANYWYESGAVTDVLIKNNKFLDPCMSSMYQFCEAIISIFPEIPKPATGKTFHKNIRIEGNEFYPFDYPVLYAKSVDGLNFTGNTLIRSTMFTPIHSRKAGLTFDACRKVTISGNKFAGDVLGKIVSLENMQKSENVISKSEPFVF